MTVYRHTQVGTLIRVILGVVIILCVALVAAIGANPIVLAVMAILSFCLAMFNSLTVEVTREVVRVRFGPGPLGKTFPTAAIREAKTVRNPWYFGWGIRWFIRGWLYNVSGLDAVEIVMEDGRVYRIGTDEPDALWSAIKEACPAVADRN